MSFQIRALPRKSFEHLFALSSEELASFRARRVVATKSPGFPCRVSLQDAAPGEETILVNFEHQDADTPFQSTHAIFVRAHAAEAHPGIDEVPEMLRSRILSLRAFDAEGMMREADLADGHELESGLAKLFASKDTAYIHLHFAKPGCYAARVDRA